MGHQHANSDRFRLGKTGDVTLSAINVVVCYNEEDPNPKENTNFEKTKDSRI